MKKLGKNRKLLIESYLQDLMDGYSNEDAISRNGEKLDSYIKKERILDKTEIPNTRPSINPFLKDKYPLFNHGTLDMIEKDLFNPMKNRHNLSLEKATDNAHSFFNIIGNIESDMRPNAHNKDSSAAGLYQQTEPNANTAANRFWRDYNKVYRDTEDISNLKRYNYDSSYLKVPDQTNLAYANLSGHGNGKYHFHHVLEGNKKEQMEKIYFNMHHTKPDKNTTDRAYKFFGFK